MNHRRPDSYHTCYTLCGLSTVQHAHTYASVYGERPFDSAFTWECSNAQLASEGDVSRVFETGIQISEIHPIYIIPHEAAAAIRQWFLKKPLDIATPTS